MNRAYDLDGVLVDFNTGFRQLIGKMTDKWLPEISNTYPTVWNYHKEAGLSNSEINEVWEHIKNSDFWETLPPLPECAQALAHIHGQRVDGDAIYFVTSRPGKYAKHLTEFWLVAQGYEFPTVLIATNKGPICRGLEIDVFVDDKPENCIDAAMYQPDALVYLVDRPYNRSAAIASCENIHRVESVLDGAIFAGLEDLRAAA